MTRVAIIAAMAGELEPLVRGWRRETRNGVDLWRWRHSEGEWIAACAGFGVEAAARAFAEIEKDGAVEVALSSGWAGALRGEFAPGRAYRVTGVIDARTGECFRTAAAFGECWLVTNHGVADSMEKRRLAAISGAGLVDMEAAGVARLAAKRGIPFHCIKGVSDALTEPLPDFNGFISANGQFQLLRFILFAILRPWHWPALMRMRENSRKAAQGIRESLLDILDEQGTIRKRDGFPILKR
jgi:adenosylhomocysteine nucleosidase